MRYFLSLTAALALTACAASDDSTQRTLTVAKTAVAAAQAVQATAPALVATYKALTPCGEPGAGKVCYDANVAEIVQKALIGVDAAVKATQSAIDAVGKGGVSIETVTASVISAAAQLTAALLAIQAR